jgi:hypothetical protein
MVVFEPSKQVDLLRAHVLGIFVYLPVEGLGGAA